MSEQSSRPLPQLTDANRFFWTSGADGNLRFLRCDECRFIVHPPSPVCPKCLSQSLAPSSVLATGSILSYTINYQAWMPGLEDPYVIAIVELDEQAGLRLTTNIIGCSPDQVQIGDAVSVCFEQCGDIWLPLFRRVADDPEAQGQ